MGWVICIVEPPEHVGLAPNLHISPHLFGLLGLPQDYTLRGNKNNNQLGKKAQLWAFHQNCSKTLHFNLGCDNYKCYYY